MMPAGQYFIGDLSYVMGDCWGEFCKITFRGAHVRDGEFCLRDGRKFAAYATMHGDGTYSTVDGKMFDVDAGLIGCIRVDDITDEECKADIADIGLVVTFDQPFDTGVYQDTIFFGLDPANRVWIDQVMMMFVRHCTALVATSDNEEMETC